jgi:hypothetical protein
MGNYDNARFNILTIYHHRGDRDWASSQQYEQRAWPLSQYVMPERMREASLRGFTMISFFSQAFMPLQCADTVPVITSFLTLFQNFSLFFLSSDLSFPPLLCSPPISVLHSLPQPSKRPLLVCSGSWCHCLLSFLYQFFHPQFTPLQDGQIILRLANKKFVLPRLSAAGRRSVS